jgi:hypothetical protein
LSGKITSYAISVDDPFLLAYYNDDGSGRLRPPLHIIRYDHETKNLRRADVRDIEALFQGQIPMDCLGSALRIREHRGTIYIETHHNPSAGCVIVLSSELSVKTALSGWILGFLGADYAILRGSEVHFMSFHPMHIEVFDLKQNRLQEVYPIENDPQERQFSRLIEKWWRENKTPSIEKWCRENNSPCAAEGFDADLKGELAVNEAAGVFGFEAEFRAAGFYESTKEPIPPRTAAYIFREHAGTWEHREFSARQLRSLFGGMGIQELVAKKPDLVFKVADGEAR